MPTAEIITIGTELLLGETVDTNTPFIARSLRDRGVDLFRAQMVGDNAGRISEAVQAALARAEIVITTGGLGPTVDDPTRAAVARACGRTLEFHPELWEQISARLGRSGRLPTENQKRQAYIPAGASPVPNPVGTAPAFIVELGSSVVISLPGVPREMETLLTEAVLPYLEQRFSLRDCIVVRTLHAAGIGEAVLDGQIGDLEEAANPTVGLAAHSGIISIRIAAKGGSQAEARALIASVEADIRKRLGQAIYGADEQTLEAVTLDSCQAHGWTLGCLEGQEPASLAARLERTGSPLFLGGDCRRVEPTQLAIATATVQRERQVLAAVGLLVQPGPGSCDVFLCWRTPAGNREQQLAYGGPPANARRWAENIALDGLRRLCLEVPG